MKRAVTLVLFLISVLGLAQFSRVLGASDMDHAKMHKQVQSGEVPTEAGQSAFAAIQEIVGLLLKDPNTDWRNVNIDALRNHLVDMDAVTLHAQVAIVETGSGVTFNITGEEPVRSSIRRMVLAHAATMDKANGWHLAAQDIDTGASLTVTAPMSDLVKVKALGLFGLLTIGMHHQQHHLMLALGVNPHR